MKHTNAETHNISNYEGHWEGDKIDQFWGLLFNEKGRLKKILDNVIERKRATSKKYYVILYDEKKGGVKKSENAFSVETQK